MKRQYCIQVQYCLFCFAGCIYSGISFSDPQWSVPAMTGSAQTEAFRMSFNPCSYSRIKCRDISERAGRVLEYVPERRICRFGISVF